MRIAIIRFAICILLLVLVASGKPQFSPAVVSGKGGVQLPPGVTQEQVQRALKEATPKEIRDALQSLTPQQAKDFKDITGVDPKTISSLSNDQLNALVDYLKSGNIDWNKIPEKDRERIIHQLDGRARTQGVIDRNNPPLVLTPEGPRKIGGLPYKEDWQPPAAILQAAGSVGRIVDPKENLIGTAWVVRPGVIATNCHVGLNISPIANDTTQMAKDLAVDFSVTGENSSQKHRFSLKSVLYISHQKGLDLAFLEVDTKNKSGTALPEPLELSAISSLPIEGFVVGYASGTKESSGSLDTKEFADAIAKIGPHAKLTSRAPMTALVSYADFDVLLHTASTHYGSSGSPLLTSEGKVIAVHNCCNLVSDFVSGSTCYSTELNTPYNNQSITVDAFSRVAEIKKILTRN